MEGVTLTARQPLSFLPLVCVTYSGKDRESIHNGRFVIVERPTDCQPTTVLSNGKGDSWLQGSKGSIV